MFWWWRKKTGVLPFPEGPHATGCVEVMNDFSKDSLFVRLLYPTDVPVSDLKRRSHNWVPWLIDEKYVESFATLLNLWLFILKTILFFSKKIYIPTLWEEPVSSKTKKLPVVVFSHGYGATRFLCSTVCNELASRGYLVASIEHKDLSASITYYYDSEESRNRDEKIFMMHTPFLVAGKDHYTTRNEQLRIRTKECSSVLDLLNDINNGTCKNVLKSSFNLQSLKGKIELSNPILMGHSFGGATTMFTLSVDSRYKYGVVLDGWMFPLKKEMMRISQPMLFINTQTFHLEANIKLMAQFTSLPQNTLYTIRNTTHESNTDTPLVFGYWLNLFMKKLRSKTALKIQNYLILDFLHKQTGLEIDEDLVKSYLKSQDCYLKQDFIHYAKVAMKQFSIF